MNNYREAVKELVARISADPVLSEAVKGRIIPVYSEQPVDTPFIAYTRKGVDFVTHKQTERASSIDIELSLFTDSYTQGAVLAPHMDNLYSPAEAPIIASDEGYVQGLGYVQRIVIKKRI